MPSIFAADSNTGSIGKRPYEMVNAGRNTNPHPPLVDFENLDNWSLETTASEAKFEKSCEQQLWGNYAGKLTYKKTADKSPPLLRLKLTKPLAVPMPFDCIDVWIYGNNWAWESDTSTPRVQIDALFQNTNSGIIKVHLETVRWKEWFLIHRRLSPEQLKALGDKPVFCGLEIRNGTNEDVRTLYFDDISFYKEELNPLQYEPRPQRGITLPEGQTTGTNTGGNNLPKLPFPNREETILPDNFCSDYKNEIKTTNNKTFTLEYHGKDGDVVWKYEPRTGTFSDLSCELTPKNKKTQTLQFADGGIRFVSNSPAAEGQVWLKTASTLTASNAPKSGESFAVVSTFQFGSNTVQYKFSLNQKSLIIDIQSSGGNIQDITFGTIAGANNPRLVKIPYLVGEGTNRPAVLVSGNKDNPLFVLPLVDHTRSNASKLFFDYKIENGIVFFDGGAKYNPKTDGKRNDVFERLFINVSDKFEEVLPNIPNNPSPWKHITAERVWRSHGSSVHENDYKYWRRLKRYGIDKMLITDHEVMWRDGGESFTFRTYAAPGRGGDAGHLEYTQKIHNLGYIYGPYNNYTDYAPVNEYWNEDWVTRLQDGNYQPAWARCYNPKPSRAVEIEPKITEEVQKKFHFNTAYCDVHTAVMPWQYVDYDARVPGAGTFAATYYAYGELLLHQKNVWDGPVYSEGNNHWYYSGLTDGNYAQDQAYRIPSNPWLVDFDLLKIHPLENNFGMGNPGMFYGSEKFGTEKEKQKALDRFIATTLAFGHTGFLAMEYGFAGGIRSYFMVQAIAKRYGTQKVKSIHYADETGKFLTTSEAVAADAVKHNRLLIEYEDGLTIYVNGGKESTLGKEAMFAGVIYNALSPNSWFVKDPKKELTAYSQNALDTSDKCEYYVDCPDYTFAEVHNNTKGSPHYFLRANSLYGEGEPHHLNIICDRQLIVLKNKDNKSVEMIVGEPNYEGRSTVHAVQFDGEYADAVALNFDGKELGKAETRYSGSYVFVMPVEGAFSYILTPKAKPENFIQSDFIFAVPGQTVNYSIGDKKYTATIPKDAKVDSLYWLEKDGLYLAVLIKPLCTVKPVFETEKSRVVFTCNAVFVSDIAKISAELIQDKKRTAAVIDTAAETFQLMFDIEPAKEPRTLPLTLKITVKQKSGEDLFYEQKCTLKTDWGYRELPPLPEHWTAGYCQRGKQETPLDSKSGAYAYPNSELSCGVQTKYGWAIHPPYQGGVGYTYLLSGPFTVPKEDGIMFSSEIGIRSGGDNSDGVLYKVYICEVPQRAGDVNPLILAAEKNWAERSWTQLTSDLSKWQGKEIRLKLVADVGVKNNSTADWAAWAKIKLVPAKKVLITTLE